jgi:hypothetical protein
MMEAGGGAAGGGMVEAGGGALGWRRVRCPSRRRGDRRGALLPLSSAPAITAFTIEQRRSFSFSFGMGV